MEGEVQAVIRNGIREGSGDRLVLGGRIRAVLGQGEYVTCDDRSITCPRVSRNAAD